MHFAPVKNENDFRRLTRNCGCVVNFVNCVRMFERHADLEALAKTFATMPLRHQPGTAFDYGMGHIISGRCCEVAFGKTLTQIMQVQLLPCPPASHRRPAWPKSAAAAAARAGGRGGGQQQPGTDLVGHDRRPPTSLRCQDEVFTPLEMRGAGWGVDMETNKDVLPMYSCE